MQNNTAFAAEIRLANEAFLEALASSESVARNALRRADTALARARAAASTDPEFLVVGSLENMSESLWQKSMLG